MRRVSMVSVVLLGALASCGESHSAVNLPGQTATSPSGKYAAHLEPLSQADGAERLVPVVTDAAGEVVFTDRNAYNRRHGVALIWQDDDVLWIFASDAGTFRVQQVRGRWRKRADSTPPRTVQPG